MFKRANQIKRFSKASKLPQVLDPQYLFRTKGAYNTSTRHNKENIVLRTGETEMKNGFNIISLKISETGEKKRCTFET